MAQNRKIKIPYAYQRGRLIHISEAVSWPQM